MQALNKVQLIEALRVMLQPTPSDDPVPPEFQIMQAVVCGLPEADYIIFDPEAGSAAPAAINGLPTQVIVSWSGQETPEMWGYGGIEMLQTRVGPALYIYLAGSSGQSAAGFHIVPAQLLGWIDDE